MRIQGGTDSIFALLAARQSSAAAGAKATGAIEGADSATAAIATAAPAARSFDFTQMTSKEMEGAAQELYDAGEIDLTQLFMLQNAGVPLGKVGRNGEFVPLTAAEKDAARSQPLNYFQITQDAMSFIEESGKSNDPTSGYARWQGIFAALQNATEGVDLLA